MRILIRIGGTINKGDEAMLLTSIEELSRRIESARFFLVDDGSPAHYDVARFTPLLSLIPVGSTSYAKKLLRLLALAVRHPVDMARLMRRQPLVTARLLLEALPVASQVDAAIDISGYAYSSNWGIGWALRARPYLWLFQWAGKPYQFLPQAWGPFSGKDMPVFRDVCTRPARLYVRDAQSGIHVRDAAGEGVPHLGQCPDMAFLFQGETPEFGRQELERLGLESGQGPLIGMTPNFRVYERAVGQGGRNAYLAFLADVADTLAGLGMQVVLIPHEYSNKKEGCADDRLLCQIVEDRCRNPRIRALDKEYSSKELKAIVSQLNVLLGSRYHSIIAGLSQGVPTLCLGWAHKYDEIAVEFGIPSLRIETTDLQQSKEKMVAEIRAALTDAEAIRASLHATAEAMKDRVREMFDHVAATLQSGARPRVDRL